LLLVLASLGAAPEDNAALGSDEIFSCNFDNAPGKLADADYDGWPDGWTRRRSLELPEFLRMAIVAEGQTIRSSTAEPAAAEVNRVLRMELDGGGAAIESPAVAVSSRFSLLLSLRIRTKGLKHDGAWATLSLQDIEGNELHSFSSVPVSGTAEWQRVEIGPVTPSNDKVVQAAVSLHVGPKGSGSQDLAGSAEFEDLLIVRLPRMTLVANRQPGLYVEPEKPELVCEVSGVRIAEPVVRFELLDDQGKSLATHSSPLTAIESDNGPADAPAALAEGYAGRASWTPRVPGYGFYRVTASLQAPDSSDSLLTRSQTLAVLRPFPTPSRSEFGWSLPGGERPYAYGRMAELLGQAGLGWVKLPVWFDHKQAAEVERIAWFAEQLSIQGIDVVGVLDQPPEELRQVFREPGHLPVASVFLEPELWEPAVSPVMTRLSLRVRWWQLGDDQDASFVGYPQFETKLAEIKSRLEQYGQEVRLGVGWRWLYPLPTSERSTPPWNFLSYDSDPALTAQELATYLAPPVSGAKGTSAESAGKSARVGRVKGTLLPPARSSAAERWIMLSPLASSEYSPQTRVQDLVERMLSARIHGASAVFVPLPFDPEQGLMNEDGSPSELFVPWRTTASLIGGARYLGPIQLPGGSTCHAFGRDDQAVLVLWNQHPTNEQLALGSGVRQIDVWGRDLLPVTADPTEIALHNIAVGELPTFVTGQNAAVARWQAGLTFDTTRVASLRGVEQSIGMHVQNPFGQGIGGELRLHAPQNWKLDARPVRFKAAAGEELKLGLPVILQSDADSGPQMVRLDFDVTADRNYKFSVYRTLQLGLEDVQIDLKTRLREDGALVVEQQLTNMTDRPVSFQCLLFPPGRRREIRQVIGASPGNAVTTFVLPKGADLIGQRLWLRAEEIGGQRVLNCSVVAER
jgi:hypothetical protein